MSQVQDYIASKGGENINPTEAHDEMKRHSIHRMSSKDIIQDAISSAKESNNGRAANVFKDINGKDQAKKIEQLKNQHVKKRKELKKEIAEKNKIEKKLEALENQRAHTIEKKEVAPLNHNNRGNNNSNLRGAKKNSLGNIPDSNRIRERSEDPNDNSGVARGNHKGMREKSTPKMKSDYSEGLRGIIESNRKAGSPLDAMEDFQTPNVKASLEHPPSKFVEQMHKKIAAGHQNGQGPSGAGGGGGQGGGNPPSNIQRITSYDQKMLDMVAPNTNANNGNKIIVNTTGNFHNTKELEALPPRERVLYEKQRKKIEEEERHRQQLNKIMQDNVHVRKMASQRAAAQYRPSTGLKSVFGGDYNGNEEEPKKVKIQEDYAMDEEEEEDANNDTILEVENEEEDDPVNIENKIQIYREKLKEKTTRVQDLEESLKVTKQMLTQTLKIATHSMGNFTHDIKNKEIPEYEDYPESDNDDDFM